MSNAVTLYPIIYSTIACWAGVGCCCRNYKYQGMEGWKKVLIMGGVAFAALAGGLYIKNVISEGQMKELTKEQVIHILKKVRKEKFLVFKQICTFAQNIAQQMRNNVNVAMIESSSRGPNHQSIPTRSMSVSCRRCVRPTRPVVWGG